MRLYTDLDGFGLLLVPVPAHLAVHETYEALHAIQNGLNLQLNGWSPRWMSLCLDNCRLIQSAGDRPFSVGGVNSKSVETSLAKAGVTHTKITICPRAKKRQAPR